MGRLLFSVMLVVCLGGCEQPLTPIEVQVVTEAGRPLPGAVLEAHDVVAPFRPVPRVCTGRDGRAWIHVRPGGQLTVAAPQPCSPVRGLRPTLAPEIIGPGPETFVPLR